MNTFIQADIFFFISSIGFFLLWLLTIILLIYLIRITSTFSRIMKKVERSFDKINDSTKEVFEEIKESTFYHFLFGKKRKGRK